MKTYHGFLLLVLMLVTSNSWAYGSSSSSKACIKPEFSHFAPAENAEVVAGSTFSFYASATTHPNSIQVAVKGLPTPVAVTPKNEGGFLVNGSIPSSLKGVYARIAITADGQNNCKGNGGWLIKITE